MSPPKQKSEFFKFNVGHLITLISFLVSGAVVYGQFKERSEQQDRRLDLLEHRLTVLEDALSDLHVVKNDVTWIKHYLDDQKKP